MSALPEMRRLRLERRDGGILVVAFDRPEVRNAIDTATCEDLRDLFGPLKHTPGDLRCIVLTGTGDRAFSAGGDLKERMGMSDDDWRAQHAIIEESAYAVLDCGVPVIAAVNGVAFGGGCEIALCCDFIHAAETARFALPEVTRGIMPGAGGTQNLPRAVGERRARQILLTGAPFTAREALDWGMVNAVWPDAELMDRVLEVAGRIAANAPVSVQQIRRSVRHGLQTDLTSALMIEVQAYERTIPTADRREGVRAFNEKRAPRFEGR
jgi:enoyl-CoA hydratase